MIIIGTVWGIAGTIGLIAAALHPVWDRYDNDRRYKEWK